MSIKIDDAFIKELQKHKGKTIIGISMSDVNISLDIEGVNKLEIDRAWSSDDEDSKEVKLFISGCR